MEKIMKLSTSHLKVKDITGICNHQAIHWYWHIVITLYPIIYIISTLLKREIFYVTYFPLYTLIININCSKKLTGTRDIYIFPTTQKLIINSDTMSIIRVLEIRLKFLFSNLRQINRFYLPSLSKTCDISLIINLMLEIHQTMLNSGKVGTWIEQLPAWTKVNNYRYRENQYSNQSITQITQPWAPEDTEHSPKQNRWCNTVSMLFIWHHVD